MKKMIVFRQLFVSKDTMVVFFFFFWTGLRNTRKHKSIPTKQQL